VDDKSLYAAILGVKGPWGVENVELRLVDEEAHVWVARPKDTLWVCPECLAAAPIHDHRDRVWRHLDTCQYRNLRARPGPAPELSHPRHPASPGPLGRGEVRFTALFEA
jgi:transposase